MYLCVFGPIEKLRNRRKNSDEEWESSGAKDAFEVAKEILFSSPVLHNPNFDLKFFVKMDASPYVVGAVLYQEREDQPCYIDFAARVFSSSQLSLHCRIVLLRRRKHSCSKINITRLILSLLVALGLSPKKEKKEKNKKEEGKLPAPPTPRPPTP